MGKEGIDFIHYPKLNLNIAMLLHKLQSASLIQSLIYSILTKICNKNYKQLAYDSLTDVHKM